MNEKRCVILRGASGVGKDWWISQRAPNYATIISADHFFMEGGIYKFDLEKLPAAHNSCLLAFLNAVDRRDRTIIVNNTNTKLWEIAPYYRVAEASGYSVEIVWLMSSVEDCVAQTQHETPREVIQAMITGADSLPPWWNVKIVINKKWESFK